MVRYPIVLEQDDNDTVLVSFPDFPEAHTFGDDEGEARARALDAVETVIDAYIRDRREIPAPSAVTGLSVTLPSLIATKMQIYNAMREQKIGKADLAKRLNVHLPQVDRLLDVRHGSKLDQLEAAARALGRELHVVLVVGDSLGLPTGGYSGARPQPDSTRTHRRSLRPTVHAGVLAAAKKKTPVRTRLTSAKKK